MTRVTYSRGYGKAVKKGYGTANTKRLAKKKQAKKYAKKGNK